MQTIQAESEELLTIDQVSMIVDIPVSTIRKYCSRYRDLMSLKRGDNNALLFSKASIEVLVKARDLTGQGVRPAAIKRLISTRSKSKPSAMVNVDEDHFSDQTSEVYPPAGQLDQFNHINHDQVMSIQEVKHQFEVKLSKIEVGFIEKLTEVLQQNEALKAQSLEREQKIISENKADTKYPIVGAASIAAKELREQELKQIRDNIKIDCGSGYPADPKTKAFLKEHYKSKEFDFIFRKSWATYKDLVKKDCQRSLDEF